MTGEDRGKGRLRQKQVAAVTDLEADIFFGHAIPSLLQHIFRDVKRVPRSEDIGELFGNAPGAAADLDAAFVLEAVMTPLRVEVLPIRFSQSIKLVVGPWRAPVFVFVGPGRNGKERIAF